MEQKYTMLEMVEYSAQALRQHRKDRRLTIKKLAEVSGVAERYIYMLEHGEKNNPTLNVLRQLGKVLGIAFY